MGNKRKFAFRYCVYRLLLLFALIGRGSAFADDFQIKKISPEGGFTFDAINTVCEDKYGFIWFGSNSGVYRYNSVETVKYINSPDDPTSLPGNTVRSLYLDLNGQMWFSTNRGLCVFDYQCECFRKYVLHDANGNPSAINVLQVFQTDDGTYWLVDNAGIATIDFKTGVVNYLSLTDTQNDLVRYAVRNKNEERIWLGGTTGGIFYCDPPYKKINFFARTRKENVLSILPNGNDLWVGYEWGGADLFTKSGDLAVHFSDDLQGRNKIPSSRVRTIFKYKNEIWLGTFKGIACISSGKTEVIEKDRYPAMINNSVFQIYRDSKNGIWISTWSGGLCYINEWSNNFEHFKREPNDNSLSDNIVTDFEEDSKGDIIVATEDGHLNYLNRANRKITDSQIRGPNGIVNHNKSICIDKKGALWIGTFANGIFFKPFGSQEYQKFNLIDDFKDQFYDIMATDEGLWFASSLRGLFYFDYKTRGVKQFISNNSDPESISSNNVKTVLADSQGNIWVGTVSGLNKKNKGSDRFIRYFYNPDEKNRISSNSIYTLFEDSKKHIWIGTSGGGVTIYDPNSGIFSQLSNKDGLAGNDVYGILEDNAGTIWMSTENGLSAYTPSTKNFRNFDFADGLQGNQFNPGAAFKAKNGELFFGGSNGFTKFDPTQIKNNPILPETFITGIEVNNQLVNQFNHSELIRQSILTLEHLDLNHDQNSLRLSFVTNNFLLPQKARFKYRLKGYSSNWVEIENDNKAIFTKIPPGDYVFEVKATNNDGLWNEKPRQLVLSIKYPIWGSYSAYFLYLIIILVIIYFILRELKIRQKLKNSILQQKIQQENEDKLHQLKLNFFTNISHEFRTPLTLILSPLSLIKKKITGQTESLEYVAIIENNANRLLRLVNQILDLRKIELGKMGFQPQPFDIVALCQEVFQCFSVHDNERKISFNFESDFSSLFIMIEPDKIDKTIFNLLSNAMKYVKDEGTISFLIKNPQWQPEHFSDGKYFQIGNPIDKEYVTIVVKNDGTRIDPSYLPNIFERFYQVPGQIEGSGIGLHLCSEYIQLHHGQIEVSTSEKEGVSFFVRLPIKMQEVEGLIECTVSQTVVFYENNILPTSDRRFTLKSKKETTILVVEDNREMRKFLFTILSDHYHVISATDGVDGLAKVKEYNPDLVVTDVLMPGMNGNEFCHLLKTDLNTSHIPILMLTALSSVENQLKGFETGADDYIVKPFDDRVLILRIRNIIESRRILREKFSGSQAEWQDGMQNLKPDRELIRRATAIVEKHIGDLNFTVDVLASELHVSRSSLHRKLKSLTDQSATEFIKFVRINKSIQLIEAGQTNIDEICFNVGFNSHSYFSKCFRKQLGQTPSEYITRTKRASK